MTLDKPCWPVVSPPAVLHELLVPRLLSSSALSRADMLLTCAVAVHILKQEFSDQRLLRVEALASFVPYTFKEHLCYFKSCNLMLYFL